MTEISKKLQKKPESRKTPAWSSSVVAVFDLLGPFDGGPLSRGIGGPFNLIDRGPGLLYFPFFVVPFVVLPLPLPFAGAAFFSLPVPRPVGSPFSS